MSLNNPILERIREALRAAAPSPAGHHGAAVGTEAPGAHPGIKQWLPAVGATLGEQIDLFARNSVDLKTDFRLVENREAMAASLRGLAREEGWQRVATHRGDLTDFAVPTLGLPVLSTDGGYEAAELEQCAAGITECEALVAQTGSVLITSRGSGGRALSVLPPHHVVLASREQMVPDLSAAYVLLRKKYDGNFPSLISFITGPSRTGDIERILVLGAHGPKKLTVLLA